MRLRVIVAVLAVLCTVVLVGLLVALARSGWSYCGNDHEARVLADGRTFVCSDK